MIVTAAVVFARAGSLGLPGKHLRSVGGRPLIAWPCETAERAAPGAAFVSTNDRAVAAFTHDCGLEVIDRPAELASSTAVVDDAWRHAALQLQRRYQRLEYLVCLEGNTIYRRWIVPEMFGVAHRAECDFVRCLVESIGADHPDWQHAIASNGRMRPLCPDPSPHRQGLPTRYKWANGPVVARVRSLLSLPRDRPRWCLRGDNRAVIVEPTDFLHIDTELDVEWAEFVLSRETAPVR